MGRNVALRIGQYGGFWPGTAGTGGTASTLPASGFGSP
jgi:hypothetical protein